MLSAIMSARFSNLFLIALLVLSLPFGAAARQPVVITMRSLPPVALPAFMRTFSFVSEGAGDISVTGITFDPADPDDEDAYGMATLRFNFAGRRLWLAPFDGHGLEDAVGAPALDAQGNVYVTGFSEFQTSAFEAVTLKYSKTGHPVWTNRLGADPSFTTGLTLAADGQGNTAVIVRTFTNNILAKLDKHGVLAWQVNLGMPAGHFGFLRYVAAFDRSGNILVSGPTESGTLLSNTVARTTKFNRQGVPQWTKTYDNGLDSAPSLITTDHRGNVFVALTAEIPNGIITSPEWAVVSYGPDGHHHWTGLIDDVSRGDEPTALTVDARGSVYVAGVSNTGAVRAAKFRKDGRLRWDKLKVTPIQANSSLRFGRISPLQVTLYQDGVQTGVATPEPVWSRIQLRFIQGD